MSEFGQRLKAYRTEKGFNQKSFAEAIGVSVVTIRAWENNSKRPSMDALILISRTLKIPSDDILGIDCDNAVDCVFPLSQNERLLLSDYRKLDHWGRRLVRQTCRLELERVSSIGDAEDCRGHSRHERYIPRYTTASAAGISAPLDGADFEMLLVDDSVPAEADFAVDIRGTSMYPYINDGDMVYVKKDAELALGDVGIFCVDGAMYCKQYYRDDYGNLILASANPEQKHTNVVVSADSGSSVTVFGKVLLDRKIKLPAYLFEQ